MMYCRTFIIPIGLACALVASATLMIPLSIPELTRQAEVVVAGTVVSKTCIPGNAGRVVTEIELDVTEVWKGSVSSSRIRIVQGGGTLGTRRTVASGEASYEVGEEVVAFLVRNDRGEGVTLGLAQGKFAVEQETGTGEKLASNVFHGRKNAPEGSGIARADSGRDKLTLGKLKQQVKEAAR